MNQSESFDPHLDFIFIGDLFLNDLQYFMMKRKSFNQLLILIYESLGHGLESGSSKKPLDD